ncbi:MAG: LuxR C-terminal-related transcriptional regulator [Planctomycetota bacterium]|nr:LuxR C-terminal-related transcriptional regulator [Planctomycetota bacterium]
MSQYSDQGSAEAAGLPGQTGSVWSALTADPLCGVSVITGDGRTLWMNDQAARLMHGHTATANEQLSKPWAERFSAEWIRERLSILRHVRETGRPALVRSIWRGWQLYQWIHSVEPDDVPLRVSVLEDSGVYLVLHRRVSGEAAKEQTSSVEYETVQSEVPDMGPLAPLSPRELEVLVLIGQGLSAKEAAAMLGRSVKTIEHHRESIGRKLHINDRVALANLAHRAGLTFADAARARGHAGTPEPDER